VTILGVIWIWWLIVKTPKRKPICRICRNIVICIGSCFVSKSRHSECTHRSVQVQVWVWMTIQTPPVHRFQCRRFACEYQIRICLRVPPALQLAMVATPGPVLAGIRGASANQLRAICRRILVDRWRLVHVSRLAHRHLRHSSNNNLCERPDGAKNPQHLPRPLLNTL
jgi:hypothetical protein